MLIDRAKKAVLEIALLGCFVFAFSCAVDAAIPSVSECKAARAKLAELTSDDYKALKAKTKTNEQVGDALAQYADNEESAAGKFALLQDAFQQYVLGKSVDKAESVYSKAQTVGGVEYALEMARPSRSKLSAYATSKNAPAKDLKERIMADEKSLQCVGIVKAKLKKAPGDESLCEQLGIEYAAIGDWESALAAFVTAAGEVAKVADWELNGGKGVDYTAATVGAFWWKFADNFERRRVVQIRIRLHAATWYREAIDNETIRGNEAAILAKRIATAEDDGDEMGVISYLLGANNRELQLVTAAETWQCLRFAGHEKSGIEAWCAGRLVQGVVEEKGPFEIPQDSTLRLRKFLDLKGALRPLDSFEVSCKWDDEITVFVNGKSVYAQGYIGGGMKTIVVPSRNFKMGRNVIAIEVINGGGYGGVEVSVRVVASGIASGVGGDSIHAGDEMVKTASADNIHQVVILRSDEKGGERWRYSTTEPEMGEEKWLLIDLKNWKSKSGATGFCTKDIWVVPPGFKKRTSWPSDSSTLWLRKEFDMNVNKKNLKRITVKVTWDDNIELWLNGKSFFDGIDIPINGKILMCQLKCLMTGKTF